MQKECLTVKHAANITYTNFVLIILINIKDIYLAYQN